MSKRVCPLNNRYTTCTENCTACLAEEERLRPNFKVGDKVRFLTRSGRGIIVRLHHNIADVEFKYENKINCLPFKLDALILEEE